MSLEPVHEFCPTLPNAAPECSSVMAPVSVRPILPAETEAVGALTVAAYESLGEPPGSYADVLAGVAARLPTCEVVAAADGVGALLGSLTFAGIGFERAPELDWAPERDGRLLGYLYELAALPVPAPTSRRAGAPAVTGRSSG